MQNNSKPVRLDSYLSKSLGISRTDAKQLIRQGLINVDGETIHSSNSKINLSQHVTYRDKVLKPAQKLYILLHKPCGFVCSAVLDGYSSALSLVDVPRVSDCHFAGRLDADTSGLVLITNDGKWSHRVTSPNKKVGKVYQVELADGLSNDDFKKLTEGVELISRKGGVEIKELTKPAELTKISEKVFQIKVTEGRYHQVKRMFAAVGNRVIKLHRKSVGEIALEETLLPGMWRYLTQAEIALF